MQLRAHHHVERTPEGENAWRSQALSPEDRTVLGALRIGQAVSELLRQTNISPGELETALVRMMRSGWVLVQEPPQPSMEDVSEDALPAGEDEEVNETDLQALLARHRSLASEEMEQSDISSPEKVLPAAPHGSHAPPPHRTSVVIEHDPTEVLPFDAEQAQSDGLLEALRHPEAASSIGGHVEEWAPPSGGLAALLRALGEPVPDGVDVSPDQEESLQDLMPVEPWGGSFPASRQENGARAEEGFVRLRDQPAEDRRPKDSAKLDTFRSSLGKVQQEQADAKAFRDRARQARQQREDDQKKVVHQQHANRQREAKEREGGTLLGLSQKLAKLKKDREQGEG